MTKKQMLDACLAIAPDFTLRLVKRKAGDILEARCTMNGKPLELSHEIGGWPRTHIEMTVLDSALRSLRAAQDHRAA